MSADKSLRHELLARYAETQGRQANPALYADVALAWPYYDANYRGLIQLCSSDSRICEIGPGHGSLLAWLKSQGFARLTGVDASPEDVEFANAHLGPGVVSRGDAASFLAARPDQFDLILMKAVLEHVPKPALLDFMRIVGASLAEGGIVLVDVPNMDWVLAAHERYMDLTHEVGFTRESLHTLLALTFNDVSVSGSRLAKPSRTQRWFRPALIAVLRRALYILGEGASETLFESRSLVAVARSPR